MARSGGVGDVPDDGDEARGGIRSSDDITRDELRRAMAARGDASSSGGSSDADDGDAAGSSGRSYRITVRDWEVFRYTLPDFFPDFNETPLEARMNAGADTGMSTAGTEGRTRKDAREGGGGGGTRKSYVWKRGVLAGTERSDPLEVIAKDRERFEERLRREGREGSMDEDGGAEGGAVEIGVDGPRRAIPPPPGYADKPVEEFGAVTKTLVALTLFFYLTALVATSSRGILGDGPPAPVPGTERALEVPPPPESIVGTAAGEAWINGVQKFR